ncbi:MAG TPA: peptidoglycan DD-metalloendopeptidase family protein [Allosphingosinicella sp.]|nr:peptidoglycan DD-metalloendopeptidase family protein [Allosphingosinicella sp.]
MNRFPILAALVGAASIAGFAAAQTGHDDIRALDLAKRQAQEAVLRSQQLERESRNATDEAARARAEASALAARIEAAEADITAAETRVRIVERLRALQRARLAERQEPVTRLTAALQMMGRRPPALALVQPGSLHDLVHVRALLASTLPIVRARTAALRQEVEAGNALRAQADRAVTLLRTSREELKRRRVALARLEAEQRRRSESLAESALFESDRALALDEEARELIAEMGTRQYQTRLRSALSSLPGPLMRPDRRGAPPAPSTGPHYRLPVEGRLITGMGEISAGGVHARGLTFAAPPNGAVIAPASGHILYAGQFRGYGNIVIIDHGSGWTSVITNLGPMQVRAGDDVRGGAPLGRAGGGDAWITVELRHRGRPFPIAPLLG